MENIKTKRIGKKCPGCGNSEYKKIISAKDSSFYSDEIWTYVKCKKCKLVYLNPQPSIEELTNHYESISNKIKVSKGVKLVMFLKNLQVRFTKIIPINKTGNLLDIGCGKDPFLEIQKKRGFNVFGTDIDKTTKEYFSDKGIEIRIGSVVEAKWNKNFFDVITMWHVLEHDINPLDTVQECKNILMKDGLLIISVPNFNSLERKIFGKYWMYLSPPRHITQLTPTTLSNILKKTHMKIYKIRYPTLIPQLWSRSLLVYLENKGIIKLSEVSRILLTVALFPIAFPINVLSMIFKTGSVMNVYVKVNE